MSSNMILISVKLNSDKLTYMGKEINHILDLILFMCAPTITWLNFANNVIIERTHSGRANMTL
jgi:hypothetical protein